MQLWDASNAARSLCNTRTVTPSAMTDSRSTSFSLLRYSINSLEGGGKGLAAPTNDAKETAKKKDDFNSVMKRKKTIHHITKEKDGSSEISKPALRLLARSAQSCFKCSLAESRWEERQARKGQTKKQLVRSQEHKWANLWRLNHWEKRKAGW